MGNVHAHAQFVGVFDPGEVMRSGEGPVVSVVGFPGVQTAHAAEPLHADPGKARIAGISGRRVASLDAEQRFPERLRRIPVGERIRSSGRNRYGR